MLLHSLTLENVRIFKEKNTFDFTPVHTPNTHQPIILIGGKNGAGKTTLFESILLCLYGQHAPGTRLSDVKYEQYINQMVPRGKKTEPDRIPAIELVFEFTHAGVKNVYGVRREWTLTPNFSEKLTITCENKILSDLEADQWQDQINELIPQRFARLFLFDGEKIQNLVEDNADNLYFQESFKSLLGLDIVDRLKDDLSFFCSHHLKGSEITEINQDLEEIENRIKEIELNKEQILQERAQIQNQTDQIQNEIENEERIVAGEGGSFARKREDLKNEKLKLEHEIVKTKNAIRDLCAGLFPFSISPKYCEILKEHLITEDEVQAQQRSQEIIHKNIEEMDRIIKSPAFWSDVKALPAEKAKVREKMIILLHEQMAANDKPNKSPLIHHLSQYDFHQLLQWIDEAVLNTPRKMHDLSEHLEKIVDQYDKVEEKISRIPNDEIIAPHITKLNELNRVFGTLEERLKNLNVSLRDLDFRLTETNRRKERNLEEIQEARGGSKKIDLALKVNTVLNEYAKELQQKKITQLSDNILSCFSRLIRKEDYVNKIQIDENYKITLYEPDGHAIPKKLLSAGEKEIFAISLLWGLTLTSGRQLPFIIDTPLGRLDSEHRGNLVMDFFQHAGDQMIIFSTDTEIDKEYFRILQPYIARAYHLEYSKKDRFTSVSPGYFWQEAKT